MVTRPMNHYGLVRKYTFYSIVMGLTLVLAATIVNAAPDDGSNLPFPPTPSGSTAARTMQESTYNPLPKPQRLPEDAPNILIILIDDAGPALPSTYGGDINTPTLDRVADSGISFNRFHTTAMCSPTRAALLTGRNHHRVGAGVIASLGNDWDGYTGTWPATSASLAKVLSYYGYASSAFGKWHNTPHAETTRPGLLIAGRPDSLWASITFIDSWAANRLSGNPPWSKISIALAPSIATATT